MQPAIAVISPIRDNAQRARTTMEQAPSPVRWQPSLWKALIHVLIVAALLAIFHQVVPPFARSFEELDLMLPVPTVLVINMSDYLVQRWIISVPAVMFLLALDVAALFFLHSVPKYGSILGSLRFAMVLVFLALIILLIIVGLMMPMNAMVDGLATA
jgi:hypothetical protein